MYRFIPQQVVAFYQNFNKSYPTVTKLDNLLVGFGKILPMTLKSVANMLVHNIFEGIYLNFNLFLAKCSNFNMSMVEWVEIIEISIIS